MDLIGLNCANDANNQKNNPNNKIFENFPYKIV